MKIWDSVYIYYSHLWCFRFYLFGHTCFGIFGILDLAHIPSPKNDARKSWSLVILFPDVYNKIRLTLLFQPFKINFISLYQIYRWGFWCSWLGFDSGHSDGHVPWQGGISFGWNWNGLWIRLHDRQVELQGAMKFFNIFCLFSVGLRIPDLSGNWRLNCSPVVEWSGFKRHRKNYPKTGQKNCFLDLI